MWGGVLSFFFEGLTPHSTITAIKSSAPVQEDSNSALHNFWNWVQPNP